MPSYTHRLASTFARVHDTVEDCLAARAALIDHTLSEHPNSEVTTSP
jgi:hypothetical protein